MTPEVYPPRGPERIGVPSECISEDGAKLLIGADHNPSWNPRLGKWPRPRACMVDRTRSAIASEHPAP
eukprot:CAMPEP_0181216902 /NCGR_PEP_ID=MMETSP1096-20121128/26848_1 /TAXON_ID=156174 ORGANISM="Chrysochromulina ericina, Strain CCMP281" /NCGR_SAMPLE_ID=MMETSP1096 /ASSEMBLY_ACC=CAM_ASM_000453 /LENGTH=67 /DNA_ID=CAMNT_0023308963 /DNA_START=217 /DNA_END=420 /DNA_ORIENTATION=+